MRATVALCVIAVLVDSVRSQGWAWAYGKKQAWFVTRALEVFPAEEGGQSPYINETISASCVQQLVVYGTALANGQDWAVKAFDANSIQAPPGLGGGKVSWTGAYEQCMAVKATHSAVTVGPFTLHHDFNSQYCRTFYQADDSEFSFTNCVPEGCSYIDVWTILSIPTADQPAFPVSYVDCGQDRQTFDASSIVCTTILAILLLIVLVSTMYDIVLNHRKSTSSEKEVESPSAESNADAIGATHVELDDRNMQGQAALAGSPPQSNTANQAPERISKGSKALLAFSLYTNIPKILSTKLPPNSYTCMYGIRFWSMMWIILGHAWQLGLTILPGPGNSVADNVGDSVKQESEQWTRAAIRNMSIAVESFFLLSGALVTMGFMKQMQRQSDKVTCRQVSIFYFHRYWRLTPVLIIVSIFTAGLFNFLVDGPMVKGTFAEGHLCRTRWWSTIFYINNLIPPYTTCLGWTWYLACDFQFYVVAPVFIILLYKYKWVGLAITIGATSLSVAIITALVALVLKGLMDYYTGFYIRPWSRFFSFGVGILLGYTMFKTKCQTKLPRWALILGWTLALFACLLAVYGDLGQGDCSWCRPHPLATRVLFLGTQRVLFALGVAWVVYVSCCGQGGFVNTFLSWKAFVPLGKLTYTCYLIHPLVIYYFEYSRSTQIHILGSTMTLFYSGYVLISYSIALFVSAAFELPMISLEKIFLPRH